MKINKKLCSFVFLSIILFSCDTSVVSENTTLSDETDTTSSDEDEDEETQDESDQKVGDVKTFTISESTFKMIYIPDQYSLIVNDGDNSDLDDDNSSINTPFWIAETEVTFQLWKLVYDWAISNSSCYYEWENTGGTPDSSSDQYPVICINWRDAVVWCNALTEYYNAHNGDDEDLELVYYIDSDYKTPIRFSGNALNMWVEGTNVDDLYIKASQPGNKSMDACNANGFRLPTTSEWSCAARYKGNDSSNDAIEYPSSSNQWWTPGAYISGDAASYDLSTTINDYAVFQTGIKEVKSKKPNHLGLYDMSGNVNEFNYDWHPQYSTYRVIRGGNCKVTTIARNLSIGFWGKEKPYESDYYYGVRIAKSN